MCLFVCCSGKTERMNNSDSSLLSVANANDSSTVSQSAVESSSNSVNNTVVNSSLLMNRTPRSLRKVTTQTATTAPVNQEKAAAPIKEQPVGIPTRRASARVASCH